MDQTLSAILAIGLFVLIVVLFVLWLLSPHLPWNRTRRSRGDTSAGGEDTIRRWDRMSSHQGPWYGDWMDGPFFGQRGLSRRAVNRRRRRPPRRGS
jgi:hypothetical protein